MIQASVEPGSYLRFDRQSYQLLDISFHIPSEHTFDKVPFDMEMHLLHRNEEAELLMLAVLFQESRETHTELAKLWQQLPQSQSVPGSPVDFDLSRLLPDASKYYSYDGSITHPPCREGVRWIVLADPVKFSANQFDMLHKIFPQNSRPTQSLGNRSILRSFP
jgi:carbonic anhydrase